MSGNYELDQARLALYSIGGSVIAHDTGGHTDADFVSLVKDALFTHFPDALDAEAKASVAARVRVLEDALTQLANRFDDLGSHEGPSMPEGEQYAPDCHVCAAVKEAREIAAAAGLSEGATGTDPGGLPPEDGSGPVAVPSKDAT